MRKLFVGGNWKSNGSVSFVKSHCEDVLNKISFDSKKIDVIVSPIYLHLQMAKDLIKNDIQVSSQDISTCKEGAFTGEISGAALKDLGIKWTIVGHSERRTLFGDTNKIVAEKVLLAEEYGLNSIACIGETKEEREGNRTLSIIQKQLKAIKDANPNWEKIVLAYEPIWAIGTGLTASPDQAQEVHFDIRKWLSKEISKDIADNTRIIYGGSVTDKTAGDLIQKEDIDGFLVGGASLKPAFKTIIENTKKI